MPNYAITIQATVLKTIYVSAKNEQEAVEEAHQIFTVVSEPKGLEKYTEETISVEELK